MIVGYILQKQRTKKEFTYFIKQIIVEYHNDKPGHNITSFPKYSMWILFNFKHVF